ncbi:DUF4374 domain-containing protein [Dysgonomonas massiliensis]|uniref:DUF4374 domain-containing protein n=1 Tax=Dysgonomonas massiliensis TaxID=2040292 RepID=UPI000C78784E|nr:DUF4374 domain-containing protein [Dysgonomonas massiliensis]
MKNLKLHIWLLTAFISSSLTFLACSDDDPTPNPTPGPIENGHFDIWVSIGSTSGMGSTNSQLVKNLNTLEKQETIDFNGTGVDITAKLYQESIIKGSYYYQVPREKDRIGKYKITNKNYEIVKEVAFKNNTLKDRRYSHAWISDNTLVLIAANGDASKVIWIKVNTDNMTIMDEGELDLPTLPAGGKFSTSGIASYRKADNRIIYSYVNNKDKTHFYVAFINPENMSVEKTAEENRAEFMAGTAYGELLQSKSFFDIEGNYYLACNTVRKGAPSTTQQDGSLLRIKKGETDFDKSYLGFQGKNYSRGKIITAEFLTTGKALLYIQDPKHTGAANWGNDYNCYYAILDLNTDHLTELALPYSSGTFSQRSLVLNDKAYIGVNPKSSAPCIYIYNIKKGDLTKGLEIQEGYSFDRIVALEK